MNANGTYLRLRGVHGTSLPARPKHVHSCCRSPVFTAEERAAGSNAPRVRTGCAPGAASARTPRRVNNIWMQGLYRVR